MEYLAGGSVLDLMEGGPLTEHQIAIIIRELLMAIEYLHGQVSCAKLLAIRFS